MGFQVGVDEVARGISDPAHCLGVGLVIAASLTRVTFRVVPEPRIRTHRSEAGHRRAVEEGRARWPAGCAPRRANRLEVTRPTQLALADNWSTRAGLW